ncbi:MAG TPA: hypothetical protein VFZ91_12310 [Allosphingosinicella sp.]
MSRAALMLACTPALASCQLGVDVKVTGPPSAPVFELAEAGWLGGDPPALGGLTVETETGPGTWKTVWSVSRDGGCEATARIAYGRVPPGFVAAGPAAAIEAGRAYQVYVLGCGYSGGAWFKPLADRIAYAPGIGDAPRRTVEAAR